MSTASHRTQTRKQLFNNQRVQDARVASDVVICWQLAPQLLDDTYLADRRIDRRTGFVQKLCSGTLGKALARQRMLLHPSGLQAPLRATSETTRRIPATKPRKLAAWQQSLTPTGRELPDLGKLLFPADGGEHARLAMLPRKIYALACGPHKAASPDFFSLCTAIIRMCPREAVTHLPRSWALRTLRHAWLPNC